MGAAACACGKLRVGARSVISGAWTHSGRRCVEMHTDKSGAKTVVSFHGVPPKPRPVEVKQ